MVVMYPKEMNEKANAAEKKMYQVLSHGLGEAHVCYHNYNVADRQTDFVVVVPGEGLVVIEVKGWYGTQLKVVDNDTIYFQPSSGEEVKYNSPLHQAEGYCYKWRDRILKELGLKIKVIPLVCYPFMTEVDFYKNELHLVSGRDYTLLKDDLEDLNAFKYLFAQKYNAYHTSGLDHFTQEVYIKVRKMQEPEAILMESLKMPLRQQRRLFEKRRYSILSYLPSDIREDEFQEKLEAYYKSWLVGTKIILISGNEEHKEKVIHFFEEKLEDELEYLRNYPQFSFFDAQKQKYTSKIFNFEIHINKALKEKEAFEIWDGIGKAEKKQQLLDFDDKTSFNYRQYEIEHTDLDRNILVKAGAGTGKTYSMVSRIGYLYYAKLYLPEQLVDAILMITFTNDAADNMKVRLKEYFTNMAILTENVEFLKAMENVSRMRISTIHSLCKKIIQKYAMYLGVGQNISIKSGIYERKQLIDQVLNDQMKKEEKYRKILTSVKKYELVSTIEDVLDELEKKNINLEGNYHFDAPKGEEILFELLTVVAKTVQAQAIENNIRDNTVHLSNLMIYLTKLVGAIEQAPNMEQTVDYLFVDEFQDTDDVQIELISRFYKIFGFKLFVVGDAKQSIYRFRGAEDKAFDQLKLRVSKGWTKQDLTLNKNYRSDSVLLQTFDQIFNDWGKKQVLDYISVGENSDQLIGVKIDPTIKESMKRVFYKQEAVPDARESFNTQLVKTIEERLAQLDEKYKESEKTGTIAILTRSNEEIKQIKAACQGKVKIETDFTENLYQLAPTKDLYYLILAIQFNTNPKYLYTLSQTNYAKSISNRVVYQNSRSPQRIIEAFEDGLVITNWKEHLGEMRKKPVLRVIREMIYEIQPWHHYANQFPEEDQEDAKKHYKMNLDLLIEEIVKECGEEYQTINTLEHYLYIKIFANQHQDERSLENKGSKHRVKCLTVHKSKGLEYDHVIVPYVHGELTRLGTNKMIIKGNTIFLRLKLNDKVKLEGEAFSKQIKQEKQDTLREEARILYVALTRAEDTVTWLEAEGLKEKSSKKSWKMLLNKEI